jgi:hypothetical protein
MTAGQALDLLPVLIERITNLEATIERLLPTPEYLGVGWLAGKYGVSESYLRQHKAALPNHGISDVPGRLLWHRDLCAEWVQVSVRAHLNAYDAMSAQQRCAIERQWKVA